jgi:glucokinase
MVSFPKGRIFLASTASKCVLVYDVGGSHISAAACFADGFKLGPLVRAGLPEQQTSDAFVDTLYSLAQKADPDLTSVEGAELAMPGPFDYARGISFMRHKFPYLFEVPLASRISERFGWQPRQVRFLNDAAAYLLGEVGAGAARGISRAVGITLGTGVGSAFAVDGHIVTEGQGVPLGGEIWNIPYNGGIVEDLISTRGLQNSYKDRTGQQREVASIAHYANGGEVTACEVFEEFGTNLGLALRHLLADFNPNVVVIGGGISRSANLFMPDATRALDGMGVELRTSKLGDNAALVGAGVAWFAQSVTKAAPSTPLDPAGVNATVDAHL